MTEIVAQHPDTKSCPFEAETSRVSRREGEATTMIEKRLHWVAHTLAALGLLGLVLWLWV